MLDEFPARYRHHWLAGTRRMLGLTGEDRDDFALTTDFLKTMEGQGVDLTQAFRRLADAAEGTHEGADAGLRALYGNAGALDGWLVRRRTRNASGLRTPAQRAQAMRAVNPVCIPRNHRVEEALSAAVEHGDFMPFETLLALLQRPFDGCAEGSGYAEPAPTAQSACYKTFCGT